MKRAERSVVWISARCLYAILYKHTCHRAMCLRLVSVRSFVKEFLRIDYLQSTLVIVANDSLFVNRVVSRYIHEQLSRLTMDNFFITVGGKRWVTLGSPQKLETTSGTNVKLKFRRTSVKFSYEVRTRARQFYPPGVSPFF